jgi:hypothetical protein
VKESQARALVAAGRILQSKVWQGGRVKIEKREGETYPQAVARAVERINPDDRAKLRELVAWVLDYELHEPAR